MSWFCSLQPSSSANPRLQKPQPASPGVPPSPHMETIPSWIKASKPAFISEIPRPSPSFLGAGSCSRTSQYAARLRACLHCIRPNLSAAEPLPPAPFTSRFVPDLSGSRIVERMQFFLSPRAVALGVSRHAFSGDSYPERQARVDPHISSIQRQTPPTSSMPCSPASSFRRDSTPPKAGGYHRPEPSASNPAHQFKFPAPRPFQFLG